METLQEPLAEGDVLVVELACYTLLQNLSWVSLMVLSNAGAPCLVFLEVMSKY